MNAEETVAWLAGFVSSRYRKNFNPRPNAAQWEHIVKILEACQPYSEDDRQYSIGIMPSNNCS